MILLSSLKDKELLRYVSAEQDNLYSTEAEMELTKRFEKLLDKKEEHEELMPLRALLIDHRLSISDLKKTLELLTECGLLKAADLVEWLEFTQSFDTPDELKACIALGESIKEIANDAGDLITRLNDLINTTQNQP